MKKPLISKRRSVPAKPAETVTAPPVPAATRAAFAIVCPETKFSVETVGDAPPVGQILMNPVPPVFVTVTFSE
jgi:hypothetical protein